MKSNIYRILVLGASMAALWSCSNSGKPIYSSHAFKIFDNRVEQDSFTAIAYGDTALVSNYRSPSSFYFSPNIDFKFSINGADNELDFNTDHHANIYPTDNKSVVLDLNFGAQASLRNYGQNTNCLPKNTKVLFRVNMRDVLDSFDRLGWYDDVHGNRIFKADFKGVFVAGSASPLSWDFANLYKNEACRMKDDDKDGIYELELTFNAPTDARVLASEWHKSKDLSKYPQLKSSFPLLNSLYNMSLEEMMLNMEADSTFRTGAAWSGVWTRDVSYSIMLALGMLEPEIAKISLMHKVKNNRIIQDTGTGGAWPCSSDRVVWTLAAWEIYEFTGDKAWLQKAYEIASNSVIDDEKIVFDPETGLMRGESSFLDWREQTYPNWMEPSDIYASLNLGTNAVYYQVLSVLSNMAGELQIHNNWGKKAADLKESINRQLWLNDKNYFGQYLTGGHYKSLSSRSEALGESFSVLFEVADSNRRSQVLENTPVVSYGIPCVFPQTPNLSPYHNNAIWPFVEAFWALANAQEKHAAGVEAAMASIMRQSALFLTNKENFVAQDGDFALTVINSDRQLWSISGQLAMIYKVLFGVNFNQHQLRFNPLVPKSLAGKYTLSNLKYRNAIFNITVEGYGDEIASFEVDGVKSSTYSVSDDLEGVHTVSIVLNNHLSERKINMSENIFAPDRPHVSVVNEVVSWPNVKGANYYRIYKNGVMLDKTQDSTYVVKQCGKWSEYQVSAVDDKNVESFLSNPVVYQGSQNITTLEAEMFNINPQVKSSGYQGQGYITMSRAKMERLNFSFDAPVAGKYLINCRYANGEGPVNTDNKCAIRSLWVNGSFATALVFPQRGINEWSNWGYTNLQTIDLKQGINRFVIQFDSFNENMNGDVNEFALDQIILTKIE